MLRLAMVQMTSSNNLDANISKMDNLIAKAAQEGAKVVVLPEMAYFTGKPEECAAITSRYQWAVDHFENLAVKHNIYLAPGTLREPVVGSPDRFFNTLLFINPQGKTLSKYRKIFLFRAQIGENKYEESKYCEAGKLVCVAETPVASFGLAICFDLRFPELFRALRARKSHIILLPAAFTVPTGKAHWETLLRARAIENQCFVIGIGANGKNGEGRDVYGHSLAFGPWGEALNQTNDQEGIFLVDVSLDAIKSAQEKVHAWSSLREDLFPLS